MDDKEIEQLAKAILALPGIDGTHDSDLVIEEDVDNGIYLKFMSDGGVTDDANGKVLAAYLQAQNCVVEQSRPRSMTIQEEDLRRVFFNSDSLSVALAVKAVESDPNPQPPFPEVQGRVTRYFGTKRVDWCWGENPNAWKDTFRHWLEVWVGPTQEPLRQNVAGYDGPAYLEDEGKFYVAFTGYFAGCMPIEQPLQMNQGTEA